MATSCTVQLRRPFRSVSFSVQNIQVCCWKLSLDDWIFIWWEANYDWNKPLVEKPIVARCATGQEVCHILWSNCAACWSPVEACCEPDVSSSHLQTLFLRSSLIARPSLDYRFCHAFFLPHRILLSSFWSECKVSSCWLYIYVEVPGDKSIMHIRMTLYWGCLIVLWLFCLVCVLYCGCFHIFCNMWVCRSGFCNVWVCVCVGFVMCGCFDKCVGVW